MKSNPQTIDRSIHRLENSVIDGEPSLAGLDRRRAGTDLHFVPVILVRLHDELGLAPKTQIRRVGNPDGPRSDFRMRTVKPGIEPVKLFRKNYHVPIIRLRYERDLFYVFEVPRLSKSDPHSISRV